MRERPLRGAGRPAGGAKDAWRHLGMYSFRIERIHPQTPEEKFWEGFRFPSQPLLETTKGGPLPPFGNPPGGRGTRDEGSARRVVVPYGSAGDER